MAFLTPLLKQIPFLSPVSNYIFLMAVYVTTSALRSLCSQFVRARELVKLFSFDGILTTFLLFIFSVLFVSIFEMGIKGVLLSVILLIMLQMLPVIYISIISSLKKKIIFCLSMTTQVQTTWQTFYNCQNFQGN